MLVRLTPALDRSEYKILRHPKWAADAAVFLQRPGWHLTSFGWEFTCSKRGCGDATGPPYRQDNPAHETTRPLGLT